MKKIILLLLVALPLASFQTPATKKFNFVGTFSGFDGTQTMALIFDAEGYAAFKSGDEVLGGKVFEMNGEQGSMTYIVDQETDPVQIDLVLTKIKTGESKKVLAIAKPIDDDSFDFALTFSDVRPKDFSEEPTVKTITMTREK